MCMEKYVLVKNTYICILYIYIYIYIHEVPSISFLAQAFKIVVDSWKFSMLLLYILWDDWPIFYGFNFKWTATAAIGIHPTKAWWSQLVNFKNAIWTLEERYVIKFCFKLGKNAMQGKLDLLLWPREQDTEFPVEACWLSRTQEGQTEQIHPQTFDDPFFWQHWHDLHVLGFH